MVFTAITYSLPHLASEIAEDGRLLGLRFGEVAVAAGTETILYIPSPTNIPTVWGMLKGKNYRLNQLTIYCATLAAPTKVRCYWYGSQNLDELTATASQVIVQGETITFQLPSIVRTFSGVIPTYMCALAVGALTAADSFQSWISFEVVE